MEKLEVLLRDLLIQDPESLITSDSSICHDGLGFDMANTRKIFDEGIAKDIDAKLSWQDAVSLIFLNLQNKETAMQFIKNAEEKEENKAYGSYGIMHLLYVSLQKHSAGKWPLGVLQSLFHVGQKSILYHELEIDIEEEEKQLDEALKIIPERILMFNLAESLEVAEQKELTNKLRDHHYSSLEDAKTMETILLQLLIKFPVQEVCSMIFDCLQRMNRSDLIEVLKERKCACDDCKVHFSNNNDFYEKGPGFAIVINQMKFSSSSNFEDRKGTEQDRNELEATFTLLGVKPKDILIHNDLADTEMRDKLMGAAKHANHHHKDYAWVAVVVLSHGRRRNNKDEVVGVNGEGVDMDEIRDMFTALKCPNLQDKPKLFWFQACRSNADVDTGPDYLDNHHQRSISSDTAVPTNPNNNKPAHLNLFVQCSTIAGHNAFRSIYEGSFFIQDLCDVLQRKAETEDLMTMINEVTRRVAEHNEDYPSISEVRNSTLTAKLMFEVTEESKQRFGVIKNNQRENSRREIYN